MERTLKYRVYLIVFILGFFLVKAVIGVEEAPEVKFLLEWGKSGTASGEFNQPIGIAVDNEGYVYISDSGNNRIQKFSNNGKFISSQEGLPFGSAFLSSIISILSDIEIIFTI